MNEAMTRMIAVRLAGARKGSGAVDLDDGFAWVAWLDHHGWHFAAYVTVAARLGGGWILVGMGLGESRTDAEADFNARRDFRPMQVAA